MRWISWPELCRDEARKKKRVDPETCLTVEQGVADRLAQSIWPNAEDEAWWGSGIEETWWPGLEFGVVRGRVVMVRRAECLRGSK